MQVFIARFWARHVNGAVNVRLRAQSANAVVEGLASLFVSIKTSRIGQQLLQVKSGKCDIPLISAAQYPLTLL